MSEPSYTHHLIVLHPTEAQVLMLESEGGWQLPSFSPKDGFFPLSQEIILFMQMKLGLEGIVLRPVHSWESEGEKHFDTLYLCEIYTMLQRSGGRWFGLGQIETATLEQAKHGPFIATALKEDAGLKSISKQRPAWARRGWWKEVENWLQDELARLGYEEVGKVEQLRQWSISSVGRVQTDKGNLYFKAAPPMFIREAEITSTLSQLFPSQLPQVITSHPGRGCFVMADVGNGHPQDICTRMAALRQFAELQVEALNHEAILIASGCEVRSLSALVRIFDSLLERPETKAKLAQEDLELLHESRPQILAMVSELATCGVPETLAHADFHYGNVVMRGEDCIIFDWTDACITHPYLDIAHATSYYEEPEKRELIAAYLEPWQRAVPDARHERAFDLAEVLMPIFFAQTYVRILSSFEQGSQWAFEGEVENYLTKLAAKLKKLEMSATPYAS